MKLPAKWQTQTGGKLSQMANFQPDGIKKAPKAVSNFTTSGAIHARILNI